MRKGSQQSELTASWRWRSPGMGGAAALWLHKRVRYIWSLCFCVHPAPPRLSPRQAESPKRVAKNSERAGFELDVSLLAGVAALRGVRADHAHVRVPADRPPAQPTQKKRREQQQRGQQKCQKKTCAGRREEEDAELVAAAHPYLSMKTVLSGQFTSLTPSAFARYPIISSSFICPAASTDRRSAFAPPQNPR